MTLLPTRTDRARTGPGAAEAKADEVKSFLLSLFEGNRPGDTKGREVTAAELLEKGRSRLKALETEPEVYIETLGVLGTIHRELGRYSDPEALMEEAVRRLRASGGDPRRLARLWPGWGKFAAGSFGSEAESLFREALKLRMARLGRPTRRPSPRWATSA